MIDIGVIDIIVAIILGWLRGRLDDTSHNADSTEFEISGDLPQMMVWKVRFRDGEHSEALGMDPKIREW